MTSSEWQHLSFFSHSSDVAQQSVQLLKTHVSPAPTEGKQDPLVFPATELHRDDDLLPSASRQKSSLLIVVTCDSDRQVDVCSAVLPLPLEHRAAA